jgi:hypothetical protein
MIKQNYHKPPPPRLKFFDVRWKKHLERDLVMPALHQADWMHDITP